MSATRTHHHGHQMRVNLPTSVQVILTLVTGHMTGSSGHLLAAEPSFGKPVGGLAVAVQLDRSTIRPGKRLLAYVLLKNVTVLHWGERIRGTRTLVHRSWRTRFAGKNAQSVIWFANTN